jgi:glycine hydroxymethyltransferase
MLIDLRNKNITGKEAEEKLIKAHITVNKNMVPFDTQSPFTTSGIRIGTAAVTTRGMKEKEMVQIAQIVNEVLKSKKPISNSIMLTINKLTKGLPLFKG